MDSKDLTYLVVLFLICAGAAFLGVRRNRGGKN